MESGEEGEDFDYLKCKMFSSNIYIEIKIVKTEMTDKADLLCKQEFSCV